MDYVLNAITKYNLKTQCRSGARTWILALKLFPTHLIFFFFCIVPPRIEKKGRLLKQVKCYSLCVCHWGEGGYRLSLHGAAICAKRFPLHNTVNHIVALRGATVWYGQNCLGTVFRCLPHPHWNVWASLWKAMHVPSGSAHVCSRSHTAVSVNFLCSHSKKLILKMKACRT